MLTGLHALKLDRKKLVRNVRSDGRLKKYESVTDERAWTLDKYERQRYIRDYIAAPYGSTQAGQNGNCQDKLPLSVLLGALLSAKNQKLDDLKGQIDLLSDNLSACKKNLDTCNEGQQRNEPSDTIIYRKSINEEEIRTIETEDGILTDTNIDYSLETTEIPAEDVIGDENGARRSISQEEIRTIETDEGILDDPLENEFLQDPQQCSDSDDSYSCDDLETGAFGENGIKECDQDEIAVYIKICDNEQNVPVKEAYIGSLKLPKSLVPGQKQTVAPITSKGSLIRNNRDCYERRLLDDPCRTKEKRPRSRRSRSSGSRPSSKNDYSKQHEMIQNLNYYGSIQEYPSTENSPRSSSFDECVSQNEEECPPSTTDEFFQGNYYGPPLGNAYTSGNYFIPAEPIPSKQNFSSTAKTASHYPCTKQKQHISRKKYTSKRASSETRDSLSYNPCPEKYSQNINSEVNPLYKERTTRRRKEVEEIGIKHEDNKGIPRPDIALTKKSSQATQTDLSCSDTGQLGNTDEKNLKSTQEIDEDPLQPLQNKAMSERSHSVTSEVNDSSSQNRRSKVNQDESDSLKVYHHKRHSSNPGSPNMSQNCGSIGPRTPYPSLFTQNSRSNSLIDLQSHISNNYQMPQSRNLNCDRDYYPSEQKYSNSYMEELEYSTLRNTDQRLSRASRQQNYYPFNQASYQSTSPLSSQHRRSQLRTGRCRSRVLPRGEYSPQYLLQNGAYPPQFFQQNVSYVYPNI